MSLLRRKLSKKAFATPPPQSRTPTMNSVEENVDLYPDNGEDPFAPTKPQIPGLSHSGAQHSALSRTRSGRSESLRHSRSSLDGLDDVAYYSAMAGLHNHDPSIRSRSSISDYDHQRRESVHSLSGTGLRGSSLDENPELVSRFSHITVNEPENAPSPSQAPVPVAEPSGSGRRGLTRILSKRSIGSGFAVLGRMSSRRKVRRESPEQPERRRLSPSQIGSPTLLPSTDTVPELSERRRAKIYYDPAQVGRSFEIGRTEAPRHLLSLRQQVIYGAVDE